MDVNGGNEQAGDQEELVELWGDSFGNAALEIQENHAGSQEVKEKWVDFHRFPQKDRDLQATSGWKGRRPSLRHDCQWEGETRRSSTSSLVAWCCYRFVLYIPHQWRWKTTGMLWWPTVRKRLMRLEQSDWLIWLYPDLPVTFEIGNQDTLPKNLEVVACLTRRGMECLWFCTWVLYWHCEHAIFFHRFHSCSIIYVLFDRKPWLFSHCSFILLSSRRHCIRPFPDFSHVDTQ